MRISIWLAIVVAVVATAAMLAAAWWLLNPGGPPLESAAFSLRTLTPNADGVDDVTRLTYRLRRPATVSVYFVNAQGERFYFRREQLRESGENVVDFSGIVEPYLLPGEAFESEILARVLQNGDYTWVVEARDAAGETNMLTGRLTVVEADTALPLLENLSVGPRVFTPNQDGLDDRVRLNVYLDKDIAEGGLRLLLIGPDGREIPLAESDSSPKRPGQRGVHEYDYDGGIDNGESPPPDGEYEVRAIAEDRLGQRTALRSSLTIARGGRPLAEIYKGQVEFSSDIVVLGQTLYFTVTVENYGAAPIRTTGPFSGHVYRSMDENYNATGYYQEPGAFRVGIMCDTCQNDFPWRWALGTPETLTNIPDSQGRTQYYVLPGERKVVTGGIVLDNLVPSRNPQYFWAGLIHEDVRVLNNRADPHWITIESP
ncbi:MAG: hypothetical protein RMK99_08210 [Anaerolineales bacterium]|nr:hypothetical protein [Anaerolineales bacterium]